MADRKTQLENCASWHMERAEMATKHGDTFAAERHDMIAFRLFREAHELGR